MKHQRDDDQVLSFSDNNSANVNLTLSLGISNELASHHYPNEKIENDPPPFSLNFNQLNTQSAKHYERGSENATYEMINRGNYGLSNNYGSFNILNVELPQNLKVGSFGNFSDHHNLLPTSDHISLNHFGNKNSSVIGDESQFHTPPDNAGGNSFESSELPQTPNLQNYAILPSNSSRQRGSRRRDIIYNDPNKKCTKCDNSNTPMWRKGPFGPRSLCNACGIKYRKGKGKKKMEEATANEQ